jgi:hypothetical protein
MKSFWKWLLELLTGGAPDPPDPPPPPPPDPDPCPGQEPLDMPWCSETGQKCSEPDRPCKHNPSSDPCYEEQALPCPPVDPPPPPDEEPGILEGKPQARTYWYQKNRIADATPAICNQKRCDMVGYTGRYCCPPVPDADPRRGELERELMGGEYPVWEVISDPGSDVRRANGDDEWFCVIKGHGTGRVRWHFANGKATSKWLDIRRD